MPVAWAVALAASVLGAELRLDGGARLEGRSRTNDTEGMGGVPGERRTTVEAALMPRVGASVLSPDVDLRAQYLPTLRAPDVLTSTSPDVLHAAELRARIRLLPAWTLGLGGAGERGRTDLVSESRRRQAPPESIPTTATLRYAAARLQLTLEGALDPRTALTFGAVAFFGGGDDAASREVMPVERGVSASANLELGVTPRDALSAQATALGVRFLGDREAALSTATAAWRRNLTRTVTGRARAGALTSWSRAPGEPVHRALLPTGELGLSHASERVHTSEDLAVRLGAGVDRIRGTVDRQVELAASARWAPLSVWSFGATATGALVRQAAGRSRRAAAELRLEWAHSPQLTAALGVYGHLQRAAAPSQPGEAALPSFVEGGAFLSLSADVPRRG